MTRVNVDLYSIPLVHQFCINIINKYHPIGNKIIENLRANIEKDFKNGVNIGLFRKYLNVNIESFNLNLKFNVIYIYKENKIKVVKLTLQ